MEAAGRVRRPRRPHAAPGLPVRPARRLPRLGRRDDGPLRRPGPGPVLAELLRRRRVPARPAGRLPAARLRLPGGDPLPRRRPADHRRRAAPGAQRHLHARRGRRRGLEAQRPVHRLGRDPPHATPGHLDLRRHRQLRLRLLLVPVPGRPARAGGQGHRRGVHLGLCRGSRWATQVAPGLGAPTTSTCSRPARHDRRRRRQRRRRGGLERVPVGPGNRHGNAFTRRVTRLARESDGVRTADASVGRAWHVVNPARTNRLGQPVAYALDPQSAPLLAADRGAADQPPSPPGTSGSPATTPPSATPPATCPTSTREGPGCQPTSPPTATSTARTSCSGIPSG